MWSDFEFLNGSEIQTVSFGLRVDKHEVGLFQPDGAVLHADRAQDARHVQRGSTVESLRSNRRAARRDGTRQCPLADVRWGNPRARGRGYGERIDGWWSD